MKEDEELPDLRIENTQDVIWKESPKFYRPRDRHPGSRDLIQEELTCLRDLLGGNEDEDLRHIPLPGSSGLRSALHCKGHQSLISPEPPPNQRRRASNTLGLGEVMNLSGGAAFFHKLWARRDTAAFTVEPGAEEVMTPAKRTLSEQTGSTSSASSRKRRRSFCGSSDLSSPPFCGIPAKAEPAFTPVRMQDKAMSQDPGTRLACKTGRGRSTSILGGIARTLKQSALRFDLWKGDKDKSQRQLGKPREGLGRARRDDIVVKSEVHQSVAQKVSEAEARRIAGIGEPRSLLSMLEKLDRRLTQEDGQEGAVAETQGVEGEAEILSPPAAQRQRLEQLLGEQMQHERNLQSPEQHAPGQVDQADIMMHVDGTRDKATDPPRETIPIPRPVHSTPLRSPKPWGHDDTDSWTEDTWAQVMELTEVKAEEAQDMSPEPSMSRVADAGHAVPLLNPSEMSTPVVGCHPPDIITSTLSPMGCSAEPEDQQIPAEPNDLRRIREVTSPSLQLSGQTPYLRLRVISVRDVMEYTSKLVLVEQEATNWGGSLLLGQPWCQCPVALNDIVHLIFTDASAVPVIPLQEPILVDYAHNHLVVHPDVLISPSSVVTGTQCQRKAVISNSISSSAFQSAVPLLGTMKHSMLQTTLLLLNDRDHALPRLMDGSIVEVLEQVVDRVIARYRVDLYGLRISEPKARKELLDLLKPVVDWTRLFCLPGPHQREQLAPQLHHKQTGPNEATLPISIDHTLRVEEVIWSSLYGLKGHIDATVLGRFLQIAQAGQSPEEVEPPSLMALELKSGSNHPDRNLEHRAQLLLYSLLLRDRYHDHGPGSVRAGQTGMSSEEAQPWASDWSVLSYIKADGIQTIPFKTRHRELCELLHVRNQVAHAVLTYSRSRVLPPVLKNQSQCQRCFQVSDCMLYHKATERGDAESSGIGELFEEISSHLQAQDLEYLTKWEKLIGLESSRCTRPDRDVWAQQGRMAETRGGNCLSNMTCTSAEARAELDGLRYVYTFSRRKWVDPILSSQPGEIPRSLQELMISVGDRVLISAESRLGQDCNGLEKIEPYIHINLTSGSILQMTDFTVDIACNKAIRVPGYSSFPVLAESDSRNDVAPRANIHLAYEDAHQCRKYGARALRQADEAVTHSSNIIFRIDKDHSTINFSTMLYNVFRLFSGPAINLNVEDSAARGINRPHKGLHLVPSPGDEKRRRLIVHLDAPQFEFPPSADPAEAIHLLHSSHSDTPMGCDPAQLRGEFSSLNADQQAALEKVLTARDYALLLGMPGTGKSYTLAFIVRALISQGRTVLITSYTHNAVDSLLLKLRQYHVPVLRLGRASVVNPDLHDCLLESQDRLCSRSSLEASLQKVGVIGTTCLGTKHPLLANRHFDVCIVDEAGQILEPVCLGPLRLATAFVLVGDDNQLAPLVISSAAEKADMAKSLFTRLSQAHPHAVQCLTYQYRMNQDIMYICNRLVYSHRLKCGSEDVANARLVLPNADRLQLLRVDRSRTRLQSEQGWLEFCLMASSRSVLFVNTDGISPDPLEDGLIVPEDFPVSKRPQRDKDCPSNLTNPTEAKLVCQLVSGLLLSGIAARQVAVISSLRSQVKRIKREMSHIQGLDISTVDKLQGLDRDVVIVSLVRSNAEGKIGDLLQDRRRINVAVSRARRKLLMVGSVRTLVQADVTRELVELIRERQWIVELGADAHLMYNERTLDVLNAITCAKIVQQ